jgi:hypothetical protein
MSNQSPPWETPAIYLRSNHNYTASDKPQCFDIRAGDYILLLQLLPSGWADGVTHDRRVRGWFPSNYCQDAEYKTAVKGLDVGIEAPVYVRLAEEHVPTEAWGLRVLKGQFVQLAEMGESGWAFGSVQGRSGWFPVALCELRGKEPEESRARL